jgi:Tannase and feruloyl esterase
MAGTRLGAWAPLARHFASAPIDPAIACGDLASQDFSAVPGTSLRLTSATDVEATATDPAHCRVEGLVGSKARVVLHLPSSAWSGQYFESGCGGYCGSLNPNADCQQAFGQGAAIGYSNLGTRGMNMSWGLDAGARLDFAYVANHQVAVAARALVGALDVAPSPSDAPTEPAPQGGADQTAA